MRAKLGTAQAITATAHKIARILYHVLLTKEPYSEPSSTVASDYLLQAVRGYSGECGSLT